MTLARFERTAPLFAETRPGRTRLRIAGIVAAIGLGLMGMYKAAQVLDRDITAAVGVVADMGHQWQPIDSQGHRAYAPGYDPGAPESPSPGGLTAAEVAIVGGAALALGGALLATQSGDRPGVRPEPPIPEAPPAAGPIPEEHLRVRYVQPVRLGRPPRPTTQPADPDNYRPAAQRVSVLYPHAAHRSIATYDTRPTPPSVAELQLYPLPARVDSAATLAYA
jgi:hypothetical protein